MYSAISKAKTAFFVGLMLFGLVNEARSQEQVTKSSDSVARKSSVEEKFDREKAFADFKKLMSNSVLVGNFTIVGKEKKDLTPEEYRIAEVKKLDKGDYWSFKVRIKYMKYNVNVVVPLQVKWAGNTPVITVDGDEITGLGKFDARVVIHENKYSGTWSHGKTHGHLFGTIKRAEPEKKKGSAKSSDKK